MKRLGVLSILVVVVGIGGPGGALAQGGDTACPAIVEAAWAAAGAACGSVGQDEACYGSHRVEATFREGVAGLAFSAPSDCAPLADLHTIRTAPLDVTANEWGVAVLDVRADLPETLPGQAVRFLLMGDAMLENVVSPEYGPMEAFYLITGLGAPACAEAPDALIVHNPTGADVTLNINGLEVTLGSTVAFRIAENDGQSYLMGMLLEGEVQFSVGMFAYLLDIPGQSFALTLDPEGWATLNSRLADLSDAADAEVALQDACFAATRISQVGLIHVDPWLRLAEICGANLVFQTADSESAPRCAATAESDVQRRNGPGMDYPAVAPMYDDQSMMVVARATGTDGQVWWKLEDETWVPSGAVDIAGPCRLPVVDPPPMATLEPTPQGGGGGDGVFVYYMTSPAGVCASPTIPYGTHVILSFGTGYPTFDEAQAALYASTSYTTVNGAALPNVTRSEVTQNPDGTFNYETRADWGVPEVGTYEVVGYSDHFPWVCTLTITP